MAEPSKVIHIRNVGHEISESDLLQVVQPFGTVAKLVMLRAKNQALIQMEDLASAVSVLQYYTTIQPSVSWIRDQQESEGVLPGEDVYIILRLDGRVRRSGRGMPNWNDILQELPQLENLLSKYMAAI